MAPNLDSGIGDISETELKNRYTVVEDEFEDHLDEGHVVVKFSIKKTLEFLRNFDYSQLIWRRVLKYALLYGFGLHGLYLFFTFQVQWKTVLAWFLFSYYRGISFTMGTHRLYSHRSFKANKLMKLLLVIGNVQGIYMSVYDHARYHRAHHKFTDTAGDHTNIKRGFTYSYIGNRLLKESESLKKTLEKIDASDVWADPFARYEHKYYNLVAFIFSFLLPSVIPVYFWNESVYISVLAMFVNKVNILNQIGFVGTSLSHMYGTRPYDKKNSSANHPLMAFILMGEGWHNYHHVFPYDYRSSEFSWLGHWNPTSMIIEMFAKLGWCWDLKIASPKLVKARMERAGDGSYEITSPKAQKFTS